MNRLVDLVNTWNLQPENQNLKVSEELFRQTFEIVPEQQREILMVDRIALLLKYDSEILRIHFAAHPAGIDHAQILNVSERLKELARARNQNKIIFGGGDRHVFPGVPVASSASPWLKIFSPVGDVVLDFEGELSQLIEGEAFSSRGILRETRNASEEKDLLAFVAREFAGRWQREITDDAARGFLHSNYFAFFMGSEIVGYARLYGWTREYWGPGVYFTGPQNGRGGLGPIGVAKKARGQGIGAEILKQSWQILNDRGCLSVRVDWTTEKEFYKKQGLREVQQYQSACLKV